MHFHRPTIISCEVVICTYQTPIIGKYLLTTTLAHLPNLEEDLERFRGQDLILMGNLNVDLDEAQKPRSQIVAIMLTEFGIVNLMHHFWKHRRFCHLKTWAQVQQGNVLRERYDYILGTNFRLFEILGIRDTRNYSSDHFSLRTYLLHCLTQFHDCNIWGRCAFLLSLPSAADLSVGDKKFQAFNPLIPPCPP